MYHYHSDFQCPVCSSQLAGNRNYNLYQQPYINSYYQSPFWHPIRETTPIKGKASWTWGGRKTKCSIPWSYNHYMTAAIGKGSPFQCGQRVRVKNITVMPFTEVDVTIIDEVRQYPANKISLHRKAFEALGISPSAGVINVEITPLH